MSTKLWADPIIIPAMVTPPALASVAVTSIGFKAFNGVLHPNLAVQTVEFETPSNVETLRSEAFSQNSALRSIVLPDSLVTIGMSSLASNPVLTTVAIPNGVDEIQAGAFAYDPLLTTVTIPNSVTTIGMLAFQYTGLTSIDIPDSVTILGEKAFWQNANLTSVTVGSGVTTIELATFKGNPKLSSVTLGSGVTSIGDAAFRDNPLMTTFTFGTDSQLAFIGFAAFQNTGLTSIDIPDSVTRIQILAFSDNSSLTSVTVGSGVGSIGARAFTNAPSLSTVLFRGNVPTDGGTIFDIGTSALGSYYFGTTWDLLPAPITYSGLSMTGLLPPLPPAPPATTPGGGGSSTPDTTPVPVTPVVQETPVANPSVPVQQTSVALIPQDAQITAPAAGRVAVGDVLVLADPAVKTDAGVTVRWSRTKASVGVCSVATAGGRAVATMLKRGTCTVVGFAPAPSTAFTPFQTIRLYRVR